jgi:phosphoribosylanthranilate isomerase
MFRIKICGVTNVADAQLVADNKADAIGLNFFKQSRRFVEPHLAREIAAALPDEVVKVGVFVNHSAREIASIADEVGLDAIQLHGDEPPQLVAQLPHALKVVRAFRVGGEGLSPLRELLQTVRAQRRQVDAVLLDADAGADFGGTGKASDWALIGRDRDVFEDVSLILAGGLSPQNVAAAIASVRPDAVDVASGVESSPGKKDPAKVRDFIAAAREAFAQF